MPPPTPTRSDHQPSGGHAASPLLPVLDLEPLRPLLEHFADLVAERLAQRLIAQSAPPEELPSRRLLTLDELVVLLPPGKRPDTWRGWLYQRTRIRGEIPGQYKLGGRLFFDPDHTLPWLLNHTNGGLEPSGLDVPGEQSLHAGPMPHEPAQARQPAPKR